LSLKASKLILSVVTELEPTVPKLLILLITRTLRCVAVPAAPSLVPEINEAPLSTTRLLTAEVAFSLTIWPVLIGYGWRTAGWHNAGGIPAGAVKYFPYIG
jgi:hypothetical protein